MFHQVSALPFLQKAAWPTKLSPREHKNVQLNLLHGLAPTLLSNLLPPWSPVQTLLCLSHHSIGEQQLPKASPVALPSGQKDFVDTHGNTIPWLCSRMQENNQIPSEPNKWLQVEVC